VKSLISFTRHAPLHEISVDFGGIADGGGFSPLLRSKVLFCAGSQSGTDLIVSAGTTFSRSSLPRFERFWFGEIPTLRGIRYGECCARIGDTPVGSDHFATIGIAQAFQPVGNGAVRFHLFANGGIAKLEKPRSDEVSCTGVKGVLAFGAGVRCMIWDRVFEFNITAPAMLSTDIKFRTIQVGMDLLASTRE
jgi:outer membrane protein assembly factor BamA